MVTRWDDAFSPGQRADDTRAGIPGWRFEDVNLVDAPWPEHRPGQGVEVVRGQEDVGNVAEALLEHAQLLGQRA